MSATGIDRRSLLGLARPRGAPNLPDRRTGGFLPQIKAERCEGCDMCARICPRGAIRVAMGEAATSYVLEQGLCDGCGVCVDICDADAVVLGRGPGAARLAVSLSSSRCRACGAPFHWPTARGAAADTCRVCAVRATAHPP